jgi:hypothetical protein
VSRHLTHRVARVGVAGLSPSLSLASHAVLAPSFSGALRCIANGPTRAGGSGAQTSERASPAISFFAPWAFSARRTCRRVSPLVCRSRGSLLSRPWLSPWEGGGLAVDALVEWVCLIGAGRCTPRRRRASWRRSRRAFRAPTFLRHFLAPACDPARLEPSRGRIPACWRQESLTGRPRLAGGLSFSVRPL